MATAAKQVFREYEVIYVLAPNADNTEAERINAKVTEVVGNFGGKLLKLDNWGRRKLAYPIQRNTRGIFVYAKYVAKPGVVAEIERNLRIADSVLRYQSSVTAAEPEEELSFEQRLGLVPSARRREPVEEYADADEIDDVPDLNAGPAEGGAR